MVADSFDREMSLDSERFTKPLNMHHKINVDQLVFIFIKKFFAKLVEFEKEATLVCKGDGLKVTCVRPKVL